MAGKRRKTGSSTRSIPLRVWIKKGDLVGRNSRHLFGALKVWGYNLALGPEWVEFKEVKKK
jgi:hypothetical protein